MQEEGDHFEQPKKKRAYVREPRYIWNTAESPQFPNQNQIKFMREEFCIVEVRYCSVPDALGVLPDFPKFNMATWCSPVQLVLKRSDTGAREVNWALFFAHMGFREIQVDQRNSTQPLWKTLALEYRGVRQTELMSNSFSLLLEEPPQSAETFSGADALVEWEPIPDAPEMAAPAETEEQQEQLVMPVIFVPPPPLSPTPGMHGASERRRIAVIKAAAAAKKRRTRPSRSKAKKFACSAAAKAVTSPAPLLQAVPPPYEELLRAFLSTENVYIPGKNKDHNIVGVIRSLITPEIYRHRDHAFFFSMADKNGLGQLYPNADVCLTSAAESLSTLELHRRVLRLEWAGETIIRALLQLDYCVEKLSQQDSDNLAAAFGFHGGLKGQGAEYWLNASGGSDWCQPIAGANPCVASLAPVLCQMKGARVAAFTRRPAYLVVDECSWGLPIAVKLFLARRNHIKRAADGRQGGRLLPMDPFDLRTDIMSLNKWRFQAIAQERAPLVEYGLLLTAYCKCLGEIASRHSAPVPGGTSDVLYFDCMLQVLPRHDLAKIRAEEETRDLCAALAELALPKSPAAEQISRVHSSIAAAMAADSHQTCLTMRLHPSQSLPTASYDPLSYLACLGLEVSRRD